MFGPLLLELKSTSVWAAYLCKRYGFVTDGARNSGLVQRPLGPPTQCIRDASVFFVRNVLCEKCTEYSEGGPHLLGRTARRSLWSRCVNWGSIPSLGWFQSGRGPCEALPTSGTGSTFLSFSASVPFAVSKRATLIPAPRRRECLNSRSALHPLLGLLSMRSRSLSPIKYQSKARTDG